MWKRSKGNRTQFALTRKSNKKFEYKGLCSLFIDNIAASRDDRRMLFRLRIFRSVVWHNVACKRERGRAREHRRFIHFQAIVPHKGVRVDDVTPQSTYQSCTWKRKQTKNNAQGVWTSERVEWVLSACGAKWARIVSLLSISERKGCLDRQSGSLLGPGRRQCDFVVKSCVLQFNYREVRLSGVLIYILPLTLQESEERDRLSRVGW